LPRRKRNGTESILEHAPWNASRARPGLAKLPGGAAEGIGRERLLPSREAERLGRSLSLPIPWPDPRSNAPKSPSRIAAKLFVNYSQAKISIRDQCK
jgi:hypothetical protein